MEVFVAKQPIVNKKEEIFAYELLYRSSQENVFPNIDGDQATADVIINSYLNIGIENLSNGKPCFINFTEKLLQLRLPTYFRPQEIVVEVLESVHPSEEIIEICKELKQLGYQIALDDVVVNEDNPFSYQLFQYADYIKVDFLLTPKEIRREIEMLAGELNKQLVAEKIETIEDFEEAKRCGYDYFQGFCFAKPAIISTRDIPTYFLSCDPILEKLVMSEMDIDGITELIERDVSLSYKLLKLINTYSFQQAKQKIYSIKQAILMLGLIEIKKWLYILSMREQNRERPSVSKDIMHISLTRAKMCELIVRIRKNRAVPSAYFTLGLFSLVDKLMGVPMEKVIQDLPLQDDLLDALRGVQNQLRDVLDLVTAVEKAEWGTISEKCGELHINEKDLFKIYAESLNWSNQLMETEEKEII